MTKIFISYRREDSQYQADRLCHILRSVAEKPDESIFIDVDNIPLGVDFHDHLKARVSECDVLIAVIGMRWLNCRDPDTNERRIDDPDDFVRIEISTALNRGIIVIPLLLDGAPIPSPEELPAELKLLSRRNGIHVNRLSFESDVDRLIRNLRLSDEGSKSPDVAAPNSASSPSLSSASGNLHLLNEFLIPMMKCLKKDNAIWARILGLRREQDSIEFRLAREIEQREVLPNHETALSLIEDWRHKMAVDSDAELARVLDAYVDHVTVYKHIRSAGDIARLPIDLGAPWPDDLYGVIEDRIRRYSV